MTVSAATSAQMSAWVNANAGSGKTYVLISRLVSCREALMPCALGPR